MTSSLLAEYIPPKPGPIINLDTNKQVGTHPGLWRFTIGQHAKIPGMPERMFVAKKSVVDNKVFVVPGS